MSVRLLRPRAVHHAHRTRSASVAALAALAALALAIPLLSGSPATARATAPVPAASPIRLWAPSTLTVQAESGRVWSDLGLRIVAQGQPFELWSHRPSYDESIQTVWRSPDGDVTLPEGSMSDFSGLDRFVSVRVDRTGAPSRWLFRKGCFADSQRVDPEAPPRSDYPSECAWNPYTLGSVQGVQTGWASSLGWSYNPMRMSPGHYTVTARIRAPYAQALHISGADAVRRISVTVTAAGKPQQRPGGSGRIARPAAQEPTAPSAGAVAGPTPDLQALPAWAIQVAPNGNFLQFAATVWNAGDSPLVVDGFRRPGEDLMDAYQYFFDGDGNQTGYQQVGTMEWDARATHQHWHFEDFARYSLLDASKVEAVRSRKEAFCLANTDAVDTTVPNAEWNPWNTDLSTACGDLGSLSIREVLSSGWGDTYAQFRAGQSFDLRSLPNGRYYVAVIANPSHRLVESNLDNNVSLRRIWIGGSTGARWVKVTKVGVIDEGISFVG